MSDETKAAPAAKKDGAAAKVAKPEARRVEVLRNGFKSTYGTAARGARINMKLADAEMFAKSGDVRILGAI